MQLPHQFAKDSLRSIASDRIAKSPPDDNPHATWGIIHLVRQEIEESGRNSASMMLDDLNVPVTAQKNVITPLRFRCHRKGVCLRRIPSAHDSGEDSSW